MTDIINSDKYGTCEKQKRLLAMMKDIHAFCEKSGITYTLCGGSLLGAIRHNGFIPWDDDIDIMLDRNNYNKLISEFSKCSDYFLVRELWIYRIRKENSENESDTIDIFVLDNCPDNAIVRKSKVFLLKTLQGMMKKKPVLSDYSGISKLCIWGTHVLGKLFSDSFKFKLYTLISQIGNKSSTEFTTCYNDLFKLLSVRYSGYLMQSIEKHAFEDAEFCVTADYDSYLHNQYGDYMKLPEESERVPRHGI